MDRKSDIENLFQKFINDECTAEEKLKVLAYFSDPDLQFEVDDFLLRNLEKKIASEQKVEAEISSRIFSNIEGKLNLKAKPGKIRSRETNKRFGYMMAAAILLMLIGFAYLLVPKIAEADEQKYATNFGKTKEIQLPDGSTVVLNANSRLTFSDDWLENLRTNDAFIREVWLDGEGIFEVQKLERPTRFVVHTESAEIEVLGTTFNVNARNRKTRVVLDEGKVKLKARNKEELIMLPGDLVDLSDDNFNKKQVNPDNYMAWRHNLLIFDATPISEVVDLLENNYGYKVTLQKDVVTDEMLFTGKVPVDDTELLLKMLSESFNIRISKKDNNLIFQK